MMESSDNLDALSRVNLEHELPSTTAAESDKTLESSSPRILIRKDFLFLEELGEGSFSTVYLASQVETGRRFAVKVCCKKQIIKEKKVSQIFREKEILKQLSTPDNYCPFIVRLYSTFHDEDHLYFVLTLAKKKDLLTRLKKLGGRLNVEQCQFVVSELVLALAHIHSLGIIHRDVKPENILIHENGHIMLSDFGCAKKIDALSMAENTGIIDNNKSDVENCKKSVKEGRQRKCSFVGTAFYVSPEVLNGDESGPTLDFWAVGVVMFQLLCGKRPFDDESEYLVYKRILNLRYLFPDNFPNADAKDLIQRFLVIKPNERLGAENLGGVKAVKKHPFFNNVEWEDIINRIPPEL